LRILFLLFTLVSSAALSADTTKLHPFKHDGLNNITQTHAGKPFLLLLWSIDCPACYQELELIRHWSAKNPHISIVFVSTDPIEQQAEVKQVIEEYQLNHLKHWIFAQQPHAKLRSIIDPNWYGELPRSYLYNRQHKRYTHSGVLSAGSLKKIAAALNKASLNTAI